MLYYDEFTTQIYNTDGDRVRGADRCARRHAGHRAGFITPPHTLRLPGNILHKCFNMTQMLVYDKFTIRMPPRSSHPRYPPPRGSIAFGSNKIAIRILYWFNCAVIYVTQSMMRGPLRWHRPHTICLHFNQIYYTNYLLIQVCINLRFKQHDPVV